MSLLDRGLAHNGPQTKEARDLLKSVVALLLSRVYPDRGDSLAGANLDPRMAGAFGGKVPSLNGCVAR